MAFIVTLIAVVLLTSVAYWLLHGRLADAQAGLHYQQGYSAGVSRLPSYTNEPPLLEMIGRGEAARAAAWLAGFHAARSMNLNFQHAERLFISLHESGDLRRLASEFRYRYAKFQEQEPNGRNPAMAFEEFARRAVRQLIGQRGQVLAAAV